MAEVARRAKQAQAATQQRAAEAQQQASQQLQAVSTERDSLYEEKTLEEDGQRTPITKEERQRREISEAFDLVRYEILGNTERVEAPGKVDVQVLPRDHICDELCAEAGRGM
jgi:hypothetical protein